LGYIHCLFIQACTAYNKYFFFFFAGAECFPALEIALSHCKEEEDNGPYVKNQLVGGIDSRDVIIVGKELHDGHFV
jgi:hypothetical protein